MDRTKAIELLKKALGCVQTDPKDCASKKCSKCENNATKEDGIEALSMAIAALEKAETNCPEIPDSWIPLTKEMPEEHDTMFAKFWGTDRWNKYMFRKRSDLVEVTIELDDGTRVTSASRTRDGRWDVEERHGALNMKVVAWHPMSAPWKGEG